MDIRKFFSPGGGAKTKPPQSTDKQNKSKDSDKQKGKITNSDKHNGKTEHITSEEEFQIDENDNRKTESKSKKTEKESGGKKMDSKKKDKSHADKYDTKGKKEEKHKTSSEGKRTKEKKKEKLLDDDLIEIEDDSDDERQKKSKPRSKERKTNKRKKTIESDDDVDGSEHKGRDRKRKKQVSSEEEFDDEEVILKPKPKKKKKGKASQRILDSDSDEDPVPKKKRERKKKETLVHIGGSGDEEEIKPKKTFLDKFLTSPQKQKPIEEPAKSEPKEKKSEVSVSDFFGSRSVHRVERKSTMTVIKDKAEAEKQASSFQIEDVEMHSDEDFERTLELLDEADAKEEQDKKKKVEEKDHVVKESPSKSKENGEKSSLASKLASKAKSVISGSPEVKKVVFVPDTPVNKQPSPKKSKPSPKRSKMEFIPSSKPSPPKAETKVPVKTSPVKTSPAKVSPKKTETSQAKKPSPAKQDSETPHRGTGYRSYLNRAGPQALGSKEIPEGAENCLEGLTFVITGVLESMERDEAKSLVEQYGGKVTGNVSKKTNYVIAGRDSGQSKMSKAEQFHTKILDEDGLLDLIRSRPGKKSKYTIQAEESLKKENSTSSTSLSKLDSFKRDTLTKSISSSHKDLPAVSSIQSEPSKQKDQSEPSLLWVDKYKPTQLKQIIGQQGDKSNCKKLLHWLTNWHRNQAAGVKPVQGIQSAK